MAVKGCRSVVHPPIPVQIRLVKLLAAAPPMQAGK